MKKKAWIIIGIVLFVLVLDQVVKVLIKTNFKPGDSLNVIQNFFQLYYIENRGMAFGTTFGEGAWAKYALSIFRLIAITGIGIYLYRLIKTNSERFVFVISIALIFAGATGNLIDSMFYDLIFDVDPNITWNWKLDTDGHWIHDDNGMPVIREKGFLLGSVVDMFQFTAKWPNWMPFEMGGKDVFSAIWNVADASITIGVSLIILKYRKIFSKNKKEVVVDSTEN